MNEPRTFRSRSPRVQILPLHNIHFVPNEGQKLAVDEYPLANLSLTGVGFIRSTGIEWPEIGVTIEGHFHSLNQETPAQLKIIQKTPQAVGCKIEETSLSEVQSMIQNYFQLEMSALKLKPAQSESERETSGPRPQKKQTRFFDGSPTWLVEENQSSEVYLLEKEGEVTYFSLTFFGNYLEGGKGRDLTFGYIVDEKTLSEPETPEASLVRSEPGLPGGILSAALTFVSNIDQLTAEQRDSIRQQIELHLSEAA